jgi:hypothetical protein
MQINCVLNAVTTVLDWDIPDEGCSEAVNAQVCHLTGLDREESWDGHGCDRWGYGIDTPAH